ncbi:3-deoxy-D-manno-octulosonate 8-phosphate phosphatase (KDO 8-P phosphatase) [Nonlabens sp. Hel1_33_55]|uniref:KdsC family phosphatase n=1 Tax=Nonlabens sp. Hel1_33_55 TaxID=1336802 RepID=UPI000875E525|nr:HAD-IIIA family hydrolase [Nonlabens sp. Hel1_33_55]SCY03534.1 3-deoxy-D-manno-octulosonate 8-phosphate phosphatase (KDO 8-P phosphatase) [Nonlabens sp. Hel1_33_55]
MKTNYKKLLTHIKAFIFDVDGVLTDGRLLISESGELLRTMNAKDGYAMKTALNNGYLVCIITGGKNEGVKSRLLGLGVDDVFLNASDKMIQLEEYMGKHNLTVDQILYMGDDMPDVPVLEYVGLATCPQDAIPEVKAVSDYISHKTGGDACVRDVIEQVMKVHGKWNVEHGKTAASS